MSRTKLKRIAIYTVISFAIAIILLKYIGAFWAFTGLFALWMTGNFVAWMKRHPPPKR